MKHACILAVLLVSAFVICHSTATENFPGYKSITINSRPVEKNEFDVTSGKWEITLKK